MKRSHYRKLHIYGLICIFPILAVFLLTFSVKSFAAGSESTSYFPMDQNVNGNFTDTLLDYIDNNLNTTDNYVFCYFQGIGNPNSANYKSYDFLYISIPKSQDTMLYGEINSDLIHFSLYKVGSYTPTGGQIKYYPRFGNFDVITYSGAINYFQNLTSSSYNSGTDYVSNFKLLTNNSNNAGVVLKFGADEPNFDIPTHGHAIPPDSLDIPTFGAGLVPPNSVPILNPWVIRPWSNYTPPSFDDSGIIEGLESVGDILTYSYGYLKDNISADINNLGTNIVGAVNNVSSTIQYYGGLIVSAINNGITTLYNNFVALLEPIAIPFITLVAMGTDPETGLFSIPYLTQVLLVPDAVNVIDLVVAHDEFSVIPFVTAVSIKGQYIFNTLTSLAPSHTFHVPSCYYHGKQIGDFDIDFGWYDNYKIYVDTIINGFLVTGYIVWLFVTFKDHLRGHFIDAEPNNPGSDARIFKG